MNPFLCKKQPNCRPLWVNLLCKNKIFFFSSRSKLTQFISFIEHTNNCWHFFPFKSMNKSKSQTLPKLCWNPARWKWYVCKNYMNFSFQMEFPSCQFWDYPKTFPLRNHLGEVKIYFWKMIGEDACEMWSMTFVWALSMFTDILWMPLGYIITTPSSY